MDEREFLAERFEEQRTKLRAVAYRMLGSVAEAEDAVQETWLRLSRTDTGDVDNLAAWLTTVVGRVCLTMLRSRTRRREEPLEFHLPDPLVSSADALDPEQEAILGDSVGIALLVVLETLDPAERLAFVLHDLFAVPFEEIARIVGRSEAATRQLASRARRRVRGAPAPDTGLASQREVIDAFVAAARGGDLERLMALLDPDVVVRTDGGPGRSSRVLRGPKEVAEGAMLFLRFAELARPAIVNGAAGAVGIVDGRPVSVAAFTVRGGRVAAMDILSDPARLATLDLTVLDS
ncbi:sigma-70 family RNA polymerase sigma factor [Amycolatopsis acidicola]|uniref:Sigma-70 family RNA polymerase sigma factor n=1 Tax=Amycolatopsis acidicola TaxID=2596893 RepID=A0A5N0UNG8_9PSEU|nr:sigma-70 family RNA polymerase sigma factor [Amycolatopsis acidicola]KAA9149623.1 sigma-70 family RNA polymerase sigma factor [Amycolatopsis acidicola]